MTNVATQPPGSTQPTSFKSRMGHRIMDGNRLHKWLIVALAVGCVGLYVWHLVSVHQVRSRLEDRITAMETAQRSALAAQANASLRVAAHALSWAAARDLARDDLITIDGHLTRMVKERPVTRLAVIDQGGIIRVATDKKLEGQPAASALAGIPTAATEVTVAETAGELVVVAPLMHAQSRIGAVVLAYERAAATGAQAPAGTATQAPAATGTQAPAQ